MAVLLLILVAGWESGAGAVSAASGPVPALEVGGSCPLTTTQQKNSAKAWGKMMPVFRHPRCTNCHGGIPDPLPGPGGATRKHSGVVDMDSTDTEKVCEDCHEAGWRIPGHKWTDLDDGELCGIQKSLFTSTQFIDHIVRDGGGVPFIELAFAGLRGLNDGAGKSAMEDDLKRPLIAEPPPGSHAQLIALARAWVTAQGGKFVGDQDCGCVAPETGEVYLLEIQSRDEGGFQGFLVTDSVSMKIRIEDTTVTIFALTNFPSAATPKSLTQPQTVINWILDPLGEINIVSTVGMILPDYPVDGHRTLKVDFTHTGVKGPLFELIGPRNARSKVGGDVYNAFLRSVQFELVAGKRVYDNFPNQLVITKLTLLSSPPPVGKAKP